MLSKLAAIVCCGANARDKDDGEAIKTRSSSTSTKLISYKPRRQLEYKTTANNSDAPVSMHASAPSVDNVSVMADSVLTSQSNNAQFTAEDVNQCQRASVILLPAPMEAGCDHMDSLPEENVPAISYAAAELATAVFADVSPVVVGQSVDTQEPLDNQGDSNTALQGCESDIMPAPACSAVPEAHASKAATAATACELADTHDGSKPDDEDMVDELMAAMTGNVVKNAVLPSHLDTNEAKPYADTVSQPEQAQTLDMNTSMSVTQTPVPSPSLPSCGDRGASDELTLTMQVAGTMTTPRIAVTITPATSPLLPQPIQQRTAVAQQGPSKGSVTPRGTSPPLNRLRSMPSATWHNAGDGRTVSRNSSSALTKMPQSARMGTSTAVGRTISPVRAPGAGRMLTPRRMRDGSMSARY